MEDTFAYNFLKWKVNSLQKELLRGQVSQETNSSDVTRLVAWTAQAELTKGKQLLSEEGKEVDECVFKKTKVVLSRRSEDPVASFVGGTI